MARHCALRSADLARGGRGFSSWFGGDDPECNGCDHEPPGRGIRFDPGAASHTVGDLDCSRGDRRVEVFQEMEQPPVALPTVLQPTFTG